MDKPIFEDISPEERKRRVSKVLARLLDHGMDFDDLPDRWDDTTTWLELNKKLKLSSGCIEFLQAYRWGVREGAKQRSSANSL